MIQIYLNHVLEVVSGEINQSWNGDFWVEYVEQFNLTKNEQISEKNTLNQKKIAFVRPF
jgi:hypothetical protein